MLPISAIICRNIPLQIVVVTTKNILDEFEWNEFDQ
mgnify:FL=1